MLVQHRIDKTNGSLSNLHPLLNDAIDYASEDRSAGTCPIKRSWMAVSVHSNALAVCNDEMLSVRLKNECVSPRVTNWQIRRERHVRSDCIFPWNCCSRRCSSMGSLARGF